jgi:hypothetical protein
LLLVGNICLLIFLWQWISGTPKVAEAKAAPLATNSAASIESKPAESKSTPSHFSNGVSSPVTPQQQSVRKPPATVVASSWNGGFDDDDGDDFGALGPPKAASNRSLSRDFGQELQTGDEDWGRITSSGGESGWGLDPSPTRKKNGWGQDDSSDDRPANSIGAQAKKSAAASAPKPNASSVSESASRAKNPPVPSQTAAKLPTAPMTPSPDWGNDDDWGIPSAQKATVKTLSTLSKATSTSAAAPSPKPSPAQPKIVPKSKSGWNDEWSEF